MLSRGATAFMQAGNARLFATGLRSTASRAAPFRAGRTQAAGGSLRNRNQRIAPMSSGISNVKMVATDIFADVKKAKIMDKFDFVKEDTIEEYGAKVILFRHKKTGAEVMSVSVPDENKVFGITFRTPPNDSTGIPHILEHSVLCGSRKYPVKVACVACAVCRVASCLLLAPSRSRVLPVPCALLLRNSDYY